MSGTFLLFFMVCVRLEITWMCKIWSSSDKRYSKQQTIMYFVIFKDLHVVSCSLFAITEYTWKKWSQDKSANCNVTICVGHEIKIKCTNRKTVLYCTYKLEAINHLVILKCWWKVLQICRILKLFQKRRIFMMEIYFHAHFFHNQISWIWFSLYVVNFNKNKKKTTKQTNERLNVFELLCFAFFKPRNNRNDSRV